MRVIFWINKGILYCRVTLAGQRAEISTGLRADKVSNGRTGNKVTDLRLAEVEYKLRMAEMALDFIGKPYDAKDVKQRYEDGQPKPLPIPRLMDILLEKDKIYIATKNHVRKFLGKQNPKVSELDQGFADRLVNFLLENHKQSTASMYFSKVRASLGQILEEMPFETPVALTERVCQGDGPKYLTLEQYEAFKSLKTTRHEGFHYLCFLWQCLSGMSMADMNAFDGKLVLMLSGAKYLTYRRVKTSVEAIIPATREMEMLLHIFPLALTERNYNGNLKGMGKRIGFDNLTSHNGRHTFGVLKLIDNISMESIKKMMGHSSIATTEKVYAEVTLDKLFKEQLNQTV